MITSFSPYLTLLPFVFFPLSQVSLWTSRPLVVVVCQFLYLMPSFPIPPHLLSLRTSISFVHGYVNHLLHSPLSTLHSPLSPLPSPLSPLPSPLSPLPSPLLSPLSPPLPSPLSPLPSPLSPFLYYFRCM